jgi:hypothetical protein
MYFDDGNGLDRAGGSERDVNEGNAGGNDNVHGLGFGYGETYCSDDVR